jgi:diguanylate cyclase (GGDEF)-like protein
MMDFTDLSSLTLKKLSPSSRFFLFIGLLVAVLILGIIDYATGTELAFSIFYLFPVGFAAWYLGWEAGVSLSILSALAWYIADTLVRTIPYENTFIPAWNTGVRLMTFLIVTVLINALHTTLEREAVNARIDPLTGAPNTRAFYEAAEIQISLLKRYQRPFSILYLDIDNFKELNDSRGHSSGDSALKVVTLTLKQILRTGDTVARLGGDEFAILLTEADARAAEIVSTRIQSAIRSKLTLTCSIGALTCVAPPPSVDELVRKVDHLMYEAKRGGKDTKMSSTFAGS